MQTEHAVSSQLAESRLTGRQHSQITFTQIHLGNLGSSDKAVIAHIGTGEGKISVVHRLGVARSLLIVVHAVGGDVEHIHVGLVKFVEGGVAGLGAHQLVHFHVFLGLQQFLDLIDLKLGVVQVGQTFISTESFKHF